MCPKILTRLQNYSQVCRKDFGEGICEGVRKGGSYRDSPAPISINTTEMPSNALALYIHYWHVVGENH